MKILLKTIFVEIKIPAFQASYDFRISPTLTVQAAINNIVGCVQTIGGNVRWASMIDTLCLCSATGVLLPDKTLADYGVRSGDTLVLV